MNNRISNMKWIIRCLFFSSCPTLPRSRAWSIQCGILLFRISRAQGRGFPGFLRICRDSLLCTILLWCSNPSLFCLLSFLLCAAFISFTLLYVRFIFEAPSTSWLKQLGWCCRRLQKCSKLFCLLSISIIVCLFYRQYD